MIRRSFKGIVLPLVLVITSVIAVGNIQPAYAQTGPGGGDPCPGGPPCNPDVPISGVEWLLLIGGIFGARMVRKTIKKQP